MVIRAPTLAIAGLQDGCIAPVIFELTMGGEGEGCVPSIDLSNTRAHVCL